jgi:uncharacterized protein
MLGKLNNDQIDHVLNSSVIGRIGCSNGKTVYIIPVAFAYHKGNIYAHSREGSKVKVMRKNPNVCFQVDSIDNYTNWRSVQVWGTFEELTTEDEQKSGMKILMDRLAPIKTSETTRPAPQFSRPPEIVEKPFKTVVYRIRIEEKTGRFEKQ